MDIRQRIGDARRFRDVVTILFDEGLQLFVDRMQLRGLLPLRSRIARRMGGVHIGNADASQALEVRLRRAFERLGPTFVKLGQLLSLRPDIVPERFIREFAKLQDGVGTLRKGVAEKIVERELGMPIENVFASFSSEPLAAASLAQVHKATLRDGTEVAVKVKRPDVDDIIRTDVHILIHLAQLLERHVPEALRFRPVRVAREFSMWTLQELDFQIEGAHIDRFRANFAGDPSVVVPRVFWEHSTKSVLVTELIEGVKVDDHAALEAAGIDRKALARVGLRIGFRQFFEHGFFHGDPHPGNLVALPPTSSPFIMEMEDEKPGPRLCIYDFGIVGSLPERSRFELMGCVSAFADRDTEAFVRHMRDLAEEDDGADLRAFEREAENILSGAIYRPTEKKGLAFAFYHVLLAGGRHGVYFPTDLVLLGKAFLTLETMGIALYPEIDLEEELRPFVSQAVARELDPRHILSDARTSAFDNLLFLKQLPQETRALIERIQKGEIGVKIDLQELRDLKEEFDRQNDVRVLALLASALLVGSALALRLDERATSGGISLGRIGFAAAIVVVVWLFVLIRKRPRQ